MDPRIALEILKEHTFLTVGCTDPIAVALAAAHAFRAVGGEPREIRVRMDKNVYKDAIDVGIPGTGRRGIGLAAALGVLWGDPEGGLALLRNVDEKTILRAEEFISAHPVTLELEPEAKEIYVRAVVRTDRGVGEATLRRAHDRLSEIRVDGRVVYSEEATGRGHREGEDGGTAGKPEERTPETEEKNKDENGAGETAGEAHEGSRREGSFAPPSPLSALRDATMEELFETVAALPAKEIDFLIQGVEINRRAASLGALKGPGLGLGMKLNGLVVSGLLANDLKERIRSAVAAAADARMAGENVPIYGCFGSGNHGITLFLTLGLAAEDQCSSREELARALALALLVVGVIKCRTGILTPHCGCAVAAGSGAAAGLVLLLGGTPKQAENAVQLMTANLTGMLCDGAKYGCALKISTSAGVALESAYLAVYAEAALPGGNGLVGRTLEESMENLQTITEVGMAQVDRAVLEILLARTRRGCP